MAKKKRFEMCPAIQGVVWEKFEGKIDSDPMYGERPKNIKRKRLTCPKCGRRLESSIELEHDGYYIIHSLPAHKPKMWWKKGRPRKVRR